jgi:hypothetical protein
MNNTENDTKSTDPYNEKFCWFMFLTQPLENISEIDIEAAYCLSVDWVTCACGQACKTLPRDKDGKPKDDELYNLGVNFMDMIEAAERNYYYSNKFKNYIELALDTLFQIEKRTCELLKIEQ